MLIFQDSTGLLLLAVGLVSAIWVLLKGKKSNSSFGRPVPGM